VQAPPERTVHLRFCVFPNDGRCRVPGLVTFRRSPHAWQQSVLASSPNHLPLRPARTVVPTSCFRQACSTPPQTCNRSLPSGPTGLCAILTNCSSVGSPSGRTTLSRGRFLREAMRTLGFVHCNDGLEVHSSLLASLSRDKLAPEVLTKLNVK